MLGYHEMYGTWTGELTPAEVLQRNFWFCAVEDPSSFALRDRIGVDHILLEADYPHCDSTWPRTQQVIEEEIGALPPDDIRKITWQNASHLYRHPVPEAVQEDPNAY
jgi:Amidohydrolase